MFGSGPGLQAPYGLCESRWIFWAVMLARDGVGSTPGRGIVVQRPRCCSRSQGSRRLLQPRPEVRTTMSKSNPRDRSRVTPASGPGEEARLVNAEHERLFAIDDSAPPPVAADPISILLVEDEGIVARDLEDTLIRLGYRVSGIASEGTEAIEMARELHPQLVVMDVGLRGEVDGIEAACAIQEDAPVPVIFLTGHSDTETLQRAVSTGPLGYLIKPFQEVDLRCAIEVAIHKHRSDVQRREREELLRRSAENLSLIDELTQLKNRRGFFELASQALQVARRERQTMALFFMDLNGLKLVNDTLGHLAGDEALRDTAQVLRTTFRGSDIVARIGGDEFVALAHLHSELDVATLGARLREHLREFNASGDRPYDVDLSIGATLVDEPADQDLEAFLARADEAMYQEKKRAANGRDG
jgi:two-component system, cell cycle response regulator